MPFRSAVPERAIFSINQWKIVKGIQHTHTHTNMLQLLLLLTIIRNNNEKKFYGEELSAYIECVAVARWIFFLFAALLPSRALLFFLYCYFDSITKIIVEVKTLWMNGKIKERPIYSGKFLPLITSRLPPIWNVTETPAFTWKNTMYSCGCGPCECVGQ